MSVHPRARGEHRIAHRPLEPRQRFIPARAGNTTASASHSPFAGGSSPRARGTLPEPNCRMLARRFIPARAGNTRIPPARPHGTAGSSPRARGTRLRPASCAAMADGSSPRARGTRHGRGLRRRPMPVHPRARGEHCIAPARSPCADPVHPRARGEHPQPLDQRSTIRGSSPRARGTPEAGAARQRSRRFIPARAGNTFAWLAFVSRIPVHPRARGEHAPTSVSMVMVTVHPRARGEHGDLRARHMVEHGSSPRAGNTRSRNTLAHPAPVHPRARGEHTLADLGERGIGGSSPRARGTLLHRWHDDLMFRFIPARAGNTARRTRSRSASAVHPRARGEHDGADYHVKHGGGSSPRARGTRDDHEERRTIRRFIPARAGNTHHGISSRSQPPVHPRARGEHSHGVCVEQEVVGSSPRARGTRLRRCGMSALARFIPARAGNTLEFVNVTETLPVHPRARGEHRKPAHTHEADAGSSPRARGTREHAAQRMEEARFIPARAGNTRR